MFSAVANFLFGGDKACSEKEDLSGKLDTSEEKGPVTCCTEEADDWLLVDVSDYEEIDVNSTVKANDDADENSISSSLPFLSPVDTSFYTSSFEKPLDIAYCQDHFLLTPSSCLVSEFPEERFAEALPIKDFSTRATLGRVCRSSILSNFHENFVNVELKLSRGAIAVKSVLPRTEKKVFPSNAKKVNKRKSGLPCSCRSKQEKTDRRSHHPAELSGILMNHQPPVLVSKTELLQQIKDLKPAQQAKEYEIQKRYSKSRLNRQNKVQLYESSNKNKHRRDLWHRHSGANNNRKC